MFRDGLLSLAYGLLGFGLVAIGFGLGSVMCWPR
jgi:hypothetical protein